MNKNVKNLRKAVKQLQSDFSDAYAEYTATVREAEQIAANVTSRVSRLESRNSGTAPSAPVSPVSSPAPAPRPVLSGSDVSWLTDTLRRGATVSGGRVTITLSAQDARTIASKLDSNGGNGQFARLAANVR